MELNLDSEAYVSHSLKMLNQILVNEDIMSYCEIKEIFYTQYATNTIFSLISKEYNSIERAIKMRKFAYDILIQLMETDVFAARKSFRIWTHSNNNKNKFFGRIIRLMDQFKAYFINEELSSILGQNLDKTDHEELVRSIEWMTMLCKNDKHWQNY